MRETGFACGGTEVRVVSRASRLWGVGRMGMGRGVSAEEFVTQSGTSIVPVFGVCMIFGTVYRAACS